MQDSPFEPTIVHAASFPLSALPAETQIVQQVLDLLTGWRTRETLAGFAANMTLAGQVTYTIGSEFKVYKAGDAWSAPAGTALEEENSSAATARVFRTSLLPKAAGR